MSVKRTEFSKKLDDEGSIYRGLGICIDSAVFYFDFALAMLSALCLKDFCGLVDSSASIVISILQFGIENASKTRFEFARVGSHFA